ncbi:lysophospholipid acyltransferase family protein [Asaia prunellae]|uniref:lysophospholipid acyltransferase family protein n=1 Tax=Asaia prunellae TaxID=610245 RepID=UPI00046F09B2|nr:lysophospholipid acyltransferase family protein [Asaia prunellae]
MPSDLATAFGRSPFITYWVARALRQRIRQNFNLVRYSGVFPSIERGRGIILYANHPSWWDPAVFSLIQQSFMGGKPGFGPIDARSIERYPLLRKAGFLPLDSQSRSSIRALLNASQSILRAGGAFWITAQGAFTDVRTRPCLLQPGLAHIAKRNPQALILPVALDYTFTAESRPDIVIRFGEPFEGTNCSIAFLTKQLAQVLEATCNDLTNQVITREADCFQTLLQGKAGMGGLYGSLQHALSGLKGRKHDPRHVP